MSCRYTDKHRDVKSKGVTQFDESSNEADETTGKRRLMKRTIDLVIVITLGCFSIPLMLAIAVAIKISSRGPILYAQERIGRDGIPFRIWKFRTMLEGADDLLDDYLQNDPELRQQWERNRKLDSDPRVIPWIGGFLRRSCLDELPQLWNVLKGEMSIVGPRPLPRYHLDQFDAQFRRYREQVTPGLTGLWQVASRDDGHPEMYVKWDSYYIQNRSLWLDMEILVRTFKVVISTSGAS